MEEVLYIAEAINIILFLDDIFYGQKSVLQKRKGVVHERKDLY